MWIYWYTLRSKRRCKEKKMKLIFRSLSVEFYTTEDNRPNVFGTWQIVRNNKTNYEVSKITETINLAKGVSYNLY